MGVAPIIGTSGRSGKLTSSWGALTMGWMANRLPLHALHAELGAVFDAPCGWELPFSYGNPEGEHRAVRSAAGVVDQSLSSILEVTGRDRVAFLQGMLTNDLKVLSPGQGCPAAFLDAHGKVQALLTALVLEDRLLLVLSRRGTAEQTLQALDKFLISEKVADRKSTRLNSSHHSISYA